MATKLKHCKNWLYVRHKASHPELYKEKKRLGFSFDFYVGEKIGIAIIFLGLNMIAVLLMMVFSIDIRNWIFGLF